MSDLRLTGLFFVSGGVPMAGFGMANPGSFGAARLGMPLQTQAGSSVILVSNLDEEVCVVTPPLHGPTPHFKPDALHNPLPTKPHPLQPLLLRLVQTTRLTVLHVQHHS